MRLLFCVFLYLVGLIQATPTTNSTTTDPETPSFATRTLWNIISSCILTLFACIYNAIHPNIPSPKDSANRILRRRLGIMLMALIAPELIVTWAMRQRLSACQVTKQFKESRYPNVRPSEQPESVSEQPESVPEQPENKESVAAPEQHENFPGDLARWIKRSVKAHFSEPSEDDAWTQTHSFFVLMGGFMLYDVDQKPYHTLQPDEVLKLIRNGCIDAPTLTENQILDKSKGNVISKGLIILQVAWFILQLITRAIYHLETTELEAGTLAFAVLNFLTYAVWWNKPLDVQCPHPVYWKSTESMPGDHIDDLPQEYTFGEFEGLIPVYPLLELMGWRDIPTSRKLRVPTFDGSIELEESDKPVLMFAGMLMGVIFGGMHHMAWGFAFPTYQEQVLWRMSAITITCTPWLSVFTGWLFGNLDLDWIPDTVWIIVWLSYAALYIAARANLLVLMFTTLRNLPPDAYKTLSWTSLMPHL
ncbi:hypothetical protein EDB19DRAFT_1912564 [Suillus lakei]|nr:hypothetical protein EDB19DRAFT_1912564 [Suillus lakei]